MPSIIVYTRTYGAPSEVWIKRQVVGLKRFTPRVCCLRNVGDNDQDVKISKIRAKNRILHRIRQFLCLAQTRHRPDSKTLYAWEMARIAKSIKAGLIHCHFLWNAPLAVKAGHFAKIPVICTGHGTDVNMAMIDEDYRGQLQKDVFPHIDSMIAVSGFIAKRLVEIRCPSEKISVLHLGAPIPEAYSFTNEETSSFHIVCVASFVPVKGHLDLLMAFHKALQYVPDLHLTLIGDGPERGTIEQKISALGLENAVQLTDWLSPADVQEVYRISDAYAQASFCYQKPDGKGLSEEGLPVSLIEAASHGLPLVATNSGGIPEICRDGVNGILVPERDPNAMADALVQLARNPELRRKMGRQSRAIAETEFDAEKQVQQLEDLYKSVTHN